jgi:type VI secretion system FHA domain protein
MIAIRLVSVGGEAPAAPLEASFGEAGGDIGRGADCTLVLPDPERRISRKHLQVACRGGRFFVRLISTNLLVELDGVPLAPGAEHEFGDGARIRVGPFMLRAAAAPPLASDDSQALLMTPAARPSVFGDLLRQAPAAMPQEVDLVVGEPTGSLPRGALHTAPGEAAADAQSLAEALYAGLGLPLPPPQQRTPAQLGLTGALLRACIGGLYGLLAARTASKRELGASATLIQTRQNNPLKFAPDAEAALALLLAPPRRGFVAPLSALEDAFDDLHAHEVALLAGMRAALAAVLDRFAPQALEARLADQGLWDNLIAVNRKARLWERYGEQHAAIAREIEDNFDAVFADAFARAYEAQRSERSGS